MTTQHLPQELLIEIFSRLPAKSVGACRCLSKSWNSSLSTKKFIKLHLSHRIPLENLILVNNSHSLHLISSPIKDDATSKRVTPDQHESQNTWNTVVGSCDGLILLVNEDFEISLMNPITLELVNIPNLPSRLKKNESFRMHGFGYDSSSDDYKIVILSYANTDNEYEPDCADTFVNVYSLKKGIWTNSDTSPYDHAVPYLSSGAYVNGAIHWLASSRDPGYRSVIAAFDLTKEVFFEIPAPEGSDESKFVFNRLCVLGGFLCMLDDTESRTHTDLWIMEEYGVKKSWRKMCMESSNWNVDGLRPLCFIEKDEILFATEEESLVICDFKDGAMKEMIVDGVPASFLDGCAFVESLVSPRDLIGSRPLF